ncbi:MAG TPA: bifunctional transaldolase/phosoglucose isomerase, partial [Thermoanaerobaculia bacterium]
MSNPLVELMKVGQSVWFDQMERALVTEGTLKKMIDEDDLRGLTSNPTIFEKAIGGSDDYDDQIRELAAAGRSRDEIYEAIVLEDIGRAADVFRSVYDRTNGGDGFCSLEVSPILAPHTEETIAEAAKLWKLLGRPNVMIKIPATNEGIPAIEESIAAGININVTLIFSQSVYRKVIEAYIRGLERRAEKGLSIGSISSVASFFVSRIDSKADKEIEKKGAADLLGKVAIANAKMAYQLFKAEFGSARFAKLREKGGRPQRPLWASTGTKNANYSDVLYIEELVASETVNTVPPATYNAFKDHGKVRVTIEEDLDGARNALARLEKEGISLEKITEQLTVEGVKSFIDSFMSLMNTIEARRDVVVRASRGHESSDLGSYSDVAEEALRRVEKEKFAAKIWAKDGALWKSDESHRNMIPTALGWLGVVESMASKASELKALAEEVRRDFKHVVILGMGGSSLCSEVLRTAFGKVDGYPELHVLDSTVPAAIRALEKSIDVAKTLFVVASKSGTTTEPQMFQKYFYARVKELKFDRAGENFIAITDPDTQLQREAERDGFRKTFINPADIGGRYSALSYFGMVPAALMGVDVAAFLDRALHATHICSPALAAHQNRGALLGAILGSLALRGRDKLTLVANPP